MSSKLHTWSRVDDLHYWEMRDMMERILADCSQLHIHPVSTKNSLEAPIWSVFSGVLAHTKIFFLTNLDLFFKSLESYQRLKMNFWKRWRDERNKEKKIIFLFYSLFQTLRTKNLKFRFFMHTPRKRTLLSIFHTMNHVQNSTTWRALADRMQFIN